MTYEEFQSLKPGDTINYPYRHRGDNGRTFWRVVRITSNGVVIAPYGGAVGVGEFGGPIGGKTKAREDVLLNYQVGGLI